jgi:serine/threonine protein kinase
MSLSEGDTIAGRYRLQRQLGEGGMATVWLAVHAITNKLVALKIMRAPLAGDASSRARFLREARAASTVRHANVVEIHDVVETEDAVPVMVMEYLDGETLEARLASGPFALRELVAIMLPVCSALGAAHAAGVVHRDLKPANIFLARAQAGDARPGPVVKVLDFGLARLTSDQKKLTTTGTVVGTPRYMAPEQLFGERDIDARADIWSLGVILFECVTGHRPHTGDTPGQMVKAFSQRQIERIEDARPELPADLKTLIGRMLIIERDQRMSAIREAQEVLERLPRQKDAFAGWMKDTVRQK